MEDIVRKLSEDFYKLVKEIEKYDFDNLQKPHLYKNQNKLTFKKMSKNVELFKSIYPKILTPLIDSDLSNKNELIELKNLVDILLFQIETKIRINILKEKVLNSK